MSGTVHTFSLTDVPFIGFVADWPGPSRSIPFKWLACFGQSISRTTYASLFAMLCPIVTSTATATASNDRITATAHGLVVGDAIFIDSLTGGTGITADTTYYVATVVDANNITIGTGRTVVAATGVVTVTGAPLNITADGTSLVLRQAPYGVADANNFNLPDYREVGSIGLPTMGGTERTTHSFAWSNVLGLQAGEAAHALLNAELATHTHSTPNHTHTDNITVAISGDAAGVAMATGGGGSTRPTLTHTHTATKSGGVTSSGAGTSGNNTNVSDGAGHNTVAPGILVNKIIYTGV